MFKQYMTLMVLMAATLAGCADHEPPEPQPRPVRTVTVEHRAVGETVSLTGQIQAQKQINFAFRLDGRLIERPVNVGDHVKPGQVVGRLDPQIQRQDLRQAQANLSAAQAQRTEARNTFERYQELLNRKLIPRQQFDEAQRTLRTAEAQVNAAKAQLRTAEEQLSYTDLVSDVAGTVTEVGAEPGEVVAAGKMIVQVARQYGLDAVFDVPAQLIRTVPRNPLVTVALTDDPTIKATGRVRELAPRADPATRTFQIKVGLIDPPEAMRLGATVTGRVPLPAPAGVELPASALTEANGRPAVWVVDPKTQTVALRNVEILRYDSESIVVSRGLGPGDVVVTAGVQVLRPGQKVRLLGAKP